MIEIVVDIARYEEVQQAVAVVIAPGCSRGPAAERHTSLFGNIRERAVVIVVVEAVLAEVRDVDIGPAVVVVVGDGHAESPTVIRNSCFSGDVGERAVVIVVKKHGARRWLGTLARREG